MLHLVFEIRCPSADLTSTTYGTPTTADRPQYLETEGDR